MGQGETEPVELGLTSVPLIAGSDRGQSLLNWYDTGVPLITGSVGQGAELVELV